MIFNENNDFFLSTSSWIITWFINELINLTTTSCNEWSQGDYVWINGYHKLLQFLSWKALWCRALSTRRSFEVKCFHCLFHDSQSKHISWTDRPWDKICRFGKPSEKLGSGERHVSVWSSSSTHLLLSQACYCLNHFWKWQRNLEH